MRSRIPLTLFAALLSTAVLAADLYCVPDTYKFRPDGSVIEFSGKPAGALADGNTVWSKAQKSVTLASARNETAAFQVVVAGEAKGVRLGVSALKGEGESAIPAAGVSVSLIAFTNTVAADGGGIFADICVPLEKLGGAFDVPYSAKGLLAPPEQKVGLALVEIYVPPGTKPGKYEGELSASGGVEAKIKIALTVWPIDLPARPSIIFDVNNYSSPVASLGVADTQNPYKATAKETIEAEHNCYRLFNRHRMYLNIMPYHSQRGYPRYAPMLSGNGAETQVDWKHFDERFGPVLSGEIFDDKEPPPHFYLPFNLHWPYGYSHDESLADKRLNFRKNPKDYKATLVPAYEETFKAVSKQCVDHFAEKGWTKTGFQVFLNHSDQENANSPWRLDEPYNKYGFAVLQWYAKLTNQHMRDNDKGVKVNYRIDIGHWNCRDPKCQCYKAKNWEPDDGEGMLEPHIDAWYIGAVHAYANKHRFAALKAKGPAHEVFIYGGGDRVSGPATGTRGSMWTFYDIGLDGFCAWKVGAEPASGAAPVNGGDNMAYSGAPLGIPELLPSLRMKIFRRGSYDVEYLKLAAAKDAEKVKALLKEMIEYKTSPGNKYTVVEFPSPNNNPADYEIARLELAGIILGMDLAKGLKRQGRIDGPPEAFVDQIQGY
ncbi:MAG: hypothetical protein KIS92_00155 [Planctomycetota bacterium]|nr:hypothetical protein [Planctomycetota bacterium]